MSGLDRNVHSWISFLMYACSYSAETQKTNTSNNNSLFTGGKFEPQHEMQITVDCLHALGTNYMPAKDLFFQNVVSF